MEMKQAKVRIEGLRPYSQSRFLNIPKLEREKPDEYELRTWKFRAHYTGKETDHPSKRHVMIPPISFKNALSEAAKYLSIKVPGSGKATYTKNFEAGVLLPMEPIILPDTLESIKGEWVHVPSDGRRGGTTRVLKCFPFIESGWEGTLTFIIADAIIDQDVFMRVLKGAGSFIGIGRWRPRNNGDYGRFQAELISWGDYE